ncbi:MAG TPA: asparagine synthase-related protein [Thermoleophilaceae bacterium]|nr:asparagine synthase-related protein [Thermoleophilaceae bacterium]
MGRYGEPVVFDKGALVVAASFPGARPAVLSEPVLCLMDGYLEGDEPDPLSSLAERYSRHGTDVLSALRGTFAMVLWDDSAQRGCLARDQLGERTVYLAEQGGQLYFASEIAPLLALLPRRPAPDPTAVTHFLAWSTPQESRLLYEGVHRLEHGCVVELGNGTWKQRRYWSPRYEEPFDLPEGELAAITRENISRAVRRSIGSAARVGVLLSGGLDSSSVAALAAREVAEQGGELRTYSITFPTVETANEAPEVESVVAFHDLDATRVEVRGGSALAGALEYLDAWELPDVSFNGFFARLVSRRAAEDGMDVVLTGEGGDHVFATPEYFIADELRRAHVRSAMRLIKRFPNIAYNPWPSVRLRLLRDFGLYPFLPSRVLRMLNVRHESAHAPAYLAPDAMDLIRSADEPLPWRARGVPRWWAQKADLLTARKDRIGPMEVIARSARMSGMTVRHPINTLDLIEFVLRLPPEHGFDPDRNRPDLRRAMVGLLPEEIRLRPAKGTFNEVEALSFQDDIEVIRELFPARGALVYEYVEPDGVRAVLDRVPTRWGDLRRWGAELHQLVVIESWLRYQEDRDLPGRLLESGRLSPTQVNFRTRALAA